jgi:hypothetical protein
MAFKRASALISVATLTLDALANLLLAPLTRHAVPDVVNLFAVGGGMAAAVVAFVAHFCGRLDAKLDLTIELLVGRLDEVETRIGDRNTGFIEGYLSRRDLVTPMAPLSPHGPSVRATTTLDD